MGTADFAVEPLKALIEAELNVVAVVTMPDKPMGRGHKVKCSTVKLCALEHGIEVLQPEKLSDLAFVDRLKQLKPDLGVVVAFRMLPREVWSLPPLGTVNLHSSLLPQYRGAAPINHAVINGESLTGVSTFLLKHEIDMGDVLDQAKTIIGPNETAGELHDKLTLLGADLLLKSVRDLLSGNSKPISQKSLETGELRSAPKIFKPDCEVNWGWTAVRLHNFVRGLAPLPTAWSELSIENHPAQTYKIYELDPWAEPPSGIPSRLRPGTCYVHQGKELWVGCADRAVRVTRLQPPGKRPMTDRDLLNGLR
ncbi:methionyl-tRNA formyltransferase [Porphyromonas crevioricanis]|nr:methionyl-tRNA formyltransferase [Porphyromonas crevioricanis]